MKEKICTVINISFTALIYIFLGIGLAKAVFLPSDISQYEQRTLNKLPAPSAGSYINGDFQTDIDTALGDQISFSTYYKKLYNESTSFVDSVFSPLRHNVENHYVNYKGSYLFNGQLVARMEDLDKAADQLIYSARVISDKSAALADTQSYFFFIENDGEINFETGEKRGTYELLLENLMLPEENCARYPVDSFEEYRENFYFSDHHWNHKGSYRAYLQLLEMLSLENEALVPMEEVRIPGIFYGSKALSIGTTTYLDTISAYRFDFPAMEVTVLGNTLPDYGDMEGLIQRNQEVVSYAAVYGDDMGCMKISTGRPERENILILGDSYDNALLKLLASHFNDTHSVDLRYYTYVTGKMFVLEDYVKENNISKVLYVGGYEFFHDITKRAGW